MSQNPHSADSSFADREDASSAPQPRRLVDTLPRAQAFAAFVSMGERKELLEFLRRLPDNPRTFDDLGPFGLDSHASDSPRTDVFTPLMQAAETGDTELAGTLLRLSRPDDTDYSGNQAFVVAALAGHVECALFLAEKSNLAWRNGLGQSVLSLIAQTDRPDRAPILRAMLPLFDPLETDDLGETALTKAMVFGRPELIDILLPVSNPWQEDASGLCALGAAIAEGGETARAGIAMFVSHPFVADSLAQELPRVANGLIRHVRDNPDSEDRLWASADWLAAHWPPSVAERLLDAASERSLPETRARWEAACLAQVLAEAKEGAGELDLRGDAQQELPSPHLPRRL